MLWFIIIFALSIPLVAVILDSQLGRAVAKRLERDDEQVESGLSARLGALESDVERLTSAVQTLEEQSEFVQRLLEQRPAQDALPPGDDSE
jgi:sensor domain CHASE-containing protein